jgi:ABC-type dipeptide/oligopeptide/nickel transport system permease subunit
MPSLSPAGVRSFWSARPSINANPYMLLIPAIYVALVVLAITFVGDGLVDPLDPRMRDTQ